MCLATADAQATSIGTHGPAARSRRSRPALLHFVSVAAKRASSPKTRSPRRVLYWPQLGRQVRLEGEVAPLGEDESDDLLRCASARASARRVGLRAERADRIPRDARRTLYAHFEQRFEGEAVPRPHSWGGYLLTPSRIRVLARPAQPHARTNRLHPPNQHLAKNPPPTLTSLLQRFKGLRRCLSRREAWVPGRLQLFRPSQDVIFKTLFCRKSGAAGAAHDVPRRASSRRPCLRRDKQAARQPRDFSSAAIK